MTLFGLGLVVALTGVGGVNDDYYDGLLRQRRRRWWGVVSDIDGGSEEWCIDWWMKEMRETKL